MSNCGCTFAFTVIKSNPVSSCCDNDGADIEFTGYDELIKYIMLNVKDKSGDSVPDAIAEAYIQNAAQKFARHTGALKRIMKFDLQSGVRDYYIEAGEYEQVRKVTDVFLNFNGTKARYNLAQTRDFVFFEFFPNDKIVFNREISQCSSVEIHFTAEPVNDSCKIDKTIIERNRDAIVSGALHELFLLPDYANGALAEYHGLKFSRECRNERSVRFTGQNKLKANYV